MVGSRVPLEPIDVCWRTTIGHLGCVKYNIQANLLAHTKVLGLATLTSHEGWSDDIGIIHLKEESLSPTPVPYISGHLDDGLERNLFLGGKKRGSFNRMLTIENTRVKVGEELVFKLCCQNLSNFEVRSIRAEVKEVVTIEARKRRIPCKIEIESECETTNLPTTLGQQLGEKQTSMANKWKHSNVHAFEEVPNQTAPVNENMNSEIRIKIPWRMSNTYSGTIMNVRHYLFIHVKLKTRLWRVTSLVAPIQVVGAGLINSGLKKEEIEGMVAESAPKDEMEAISPLPPAFAPPRLMPPLEQPDGSVLVTVPSNIESGMTFTVCTTGKKKYLVTCPRTAGPNEQIRVCPPAEPTPSDPLSCNSSYSADVLVEVPGSVFPGMTFLVQAYGQEFPVTCPDGAGPGTQLRVSVPVQT